MHALAISIRYLAHHPTPLATIHCTGGVSLSLAPLSCRSPPHSRTASCFGPFSQRERGKWHSSAPVPGVVGVTRCGNDVKHFNRIHVQRGISPWLPWKRVGVRVITLPTTQSTCSAHFCPYCPRKSHGRGIHRA